MSDAELAKNFREKFEECRDAAQSVSKAGLSICIADECNQDAEGSRILNQYARKVMAFDGQTQDIHWKVSREVEF